jgi:hypothetical protein
VYRNVFWYHCLLRLTHVPLDSFPFSIDVYDIDVDDPLKYAPLVVIEIQRIKLGEKLRTMIHIELDDRDIRDVLDGQFELKLSSTHPNCLELKMPVCGYSRRSTIEAANVERTQVRFGQSNGRVQEAYDVARNAIRPHKRKKYLLRFASDVVFSNSHFSPDSVDGIVDQVDLPVESACVFSATKTYSMTQTMVTWRLTTVQERDCVVEAPAAKLTQHEKMTAMMAGMSTI